MLPAVAFGIQGLRLLLVFIPPLAVGDTGWEVGLPVRTVRIQKVNGQVVT